MLWHQHVRQLLWLASQRKGFVLLERLLLAQDAVANTGQTTPAAPISDNTPQVWLLWPRYVSLLHRRFDGFLHILLERHWPAHIRLQALDCDFAALAQIIPPFVDWHNAQGQPATAGQRCTQAAQELLQLARQLTQQMTQQDAQADAGMANGGPP